MSIYSICKSTDLNHVKDFDTKKYDTVCIEFWCNPLDQQQHSWLSCPDSTISEALRSAERWGWQPAKWYLPWQFFTKRITVTTIEY